MINNLWSIFNIFIIYFNVFIKKINDFDNYIIFHFPLFCQHRFFLFSHFVDNFVDIETIDIYSYSLFCQHNNKKIIYKYRNKIISDKIIFIIYDNTSKYIKMYHIIKITFFLLYI